ncbi:helix-turn-helix domain-containing protein [Pseudoflavitalea rhizosphaerae]|uniref:helix-turn-helix domain-containing protein n=1 Tax=Pseudoflavitalea rhizosphaerae TaxID=1884793 RepID=UPI000F8EE20D
MRKTIQYFGETIRQRRLLLGLSQDQLSAHSGVNLRTIQLLEQGKGNPTIETLLQVTEPLGMKLELKIKQPNISFA